MDVQALREVLPDPVGVDEIEARFGAVWISSTPTTNSSSPSPFGEPAVQVENQMPGE
ncbi:hypothetical protein [Streptomyces sp. NPDC093984]|uniref:hypothetical protein n=1 Tax=Streptomyces sp. NPDC093984 TaxID=3366052 RepID=UPI003811A5B4